MKIFTRVGSVIELFLVLVGPVAAAERYCADPATGDRIAAGAVVEKGKKVLRCCQRAPVSGRSSDAFFIDESKFQARAGTPPLLVHWIAHPGLRAGQIANPSSSPAPSLNRKDLPPALSRRQFDVFRTPPTKFPVGSAPRTASPGANKSQSA